MNLSAACITDGYTRKTFDGYLYRLSFPPKGVVLRGAENKDIRYETRIWLSIANVRQFPMMV